MYSKALPLLHKIWQEARQTKSSCHYQLWISSPSHTIHRVLYIHKIWIHTYKIQTKRKVPVTTSCGFQVPHIECVLYTHKTNAKLKQYTHLKYKQNKKFLSLPVVDFTIHQMCFVYTQKHTPCIICKIKRIHTFKIQTIQYNTDAKQKHKIKTKQEANCVFPALPPCWLTIETNKYKYKETTTHF